MSLLPEVTAIIAEEEKILAEVLEVLRAQASSGQVRFSIEQDRARELTAEIVATRRDEDKQQLASDEALSHRLRDMKHEELQNLDKLLGRPYFARLELEEEVNGRKKIIEYKLGTVSNMECRIIDWRKAALAKLFYEYREGDTYFEEIQGREREGKILKRHKIEIEEGRLVGLSCSYGNFRLENGIWIEAQGSQRRRAVGGGLPDVLSLITPEQFRLITEDAETAVLIQGIAGSGKTTVALHRLSWLLHDENSDCRAEDCMILVRGKVLRHYISHSLPSLHMEAVSLQTTHSWLQHSVAQALKLSSPNIARPAAVPPSNHRLKHGTTFLRCIDDYCTKQRERFFQFVETELGIEKLPESVAISVIQTLDDKTPLVPLAEKVLAVVDRAAVHYEKHERYNPVLTEALSKIKNISQRIQLFRDDIIKILSDAAFVLQRDDSKLLDREVIEKAYQFALTCKEQQQIEPSDDAVIAYLYQKKVGILPRPDGLRQTYSHVVVDEVQDHSPLELAVILQSVRRSDQLTLAGDVGQDVRSDSSFIGWEQLKAYRNFDQDAARYVSLTVNYRSTAPIMHLANHIRGTDHASGGRPGKQPLWYKNLTENSGVEAALGWINRVSEKYPADMLAVICSDRSQLNYVQSLLEPSLGALVRVGDEQTFSFDEGVIVTAVDDVKGLEFPHVLIWNPSNQHYPATQLGRNRLYVAATRAEEHLCLVTWDKPSSLLPHVHSPLVRGIEEELPEEEAPVSGESYR